MPARRSSPGTPPRCRARPRRGRPGEPLARRAGDRVPAGEPPGPARRQRPRRLRRGGAGPQFHGGARAGAPGDLRARSGAGAAHDDLHLHGGGVRGLHHRHRHRRPREFAGPGDDLRRLRADPARRSRARLRDLAVRFHERRHPGNAAARRAARAALPGGARLRAGRVLRPRRLRAHGGRQPGRGGPAPGPRQRALRAARVRRGSRCAHRSAAAHPRLRGAAGRAGAGPHADRLLRHRRSAERGGLPPTPGRRQRPPGRQPSPASGTAAPVALHPAGLRDRRPHRRDSRRRRDHRFARGLERGAPPLEDAEPLRRRGTRRDRRPGGGEQRLRGRRHDPAAGPGRSRVGERGGAPRRPDGAGGDSRPDAADRRRLAGLCALRRLPGRRGAHAGGGKAGHPPLGAGGAAPSLDPDAAGGGGLPDGGVRAPRQPRRRLAGAVLRHRGLCYAAARISARPGRARADPRADGGDELSAGAHAVLRVPLGFFESPIALLLLALAVLSFAAPALRGRFPFRRKTTG